MDPFNKINSLIHKNALKEKNSENLTIGFHYHRNDFSCRPDTWVNGDVSGGSFEVPNDNSNSTRGVKRYE